MGEDSEALVAPGRRQMLFQTFFALKMSHAASTTQVCLWEIVAGFPRTRGRTAAAFSSWPPFVRPQRTVSKAWLGRRGLMGSSVLMLPSLRFRVVFLVKVHPFVYLV